MPKSDDGRRIARNGIALTLPPPRARHRVGDARAGKTAFGGWRYRVGTTSARKHIGFGVVLTAAGVPSDTLTLRAMGGRSAWRDSGGRDHAERCCVLV